MNVQMKQIQMESKYVCFINFESDVAITLALTILFDIFS